MRQTKIVEFSIEYIFVTSFSDLDGAKFLAKSEALGVYSWTAISTFILLSNRNARRERRGPETEVAWTGCPELHAFPFYI